MSVEGIETGSAGMHVPPAEAGDIYDEPSTPRIKLAANGGLENLEAAISEMLKRAMDGFQKDYQAEMGTLREELAAHQGDGLASLEDRLVQRAADEREELNAVLADWYQQSTQSQQEHGAMIEELRSTVGACTSEGPGGHTAIVGELHRVREEMLALRAEDMLALQEAIGGLSQEMAKVMQQNAARGGDGAESQSERVEALEVACTEMATLSAQHDQFLHEAKETTGHVQRELVGLQEHCNQMQQVLENLHQEFGAEKQQQQQKFAELHAAQGDAVAKAAGWSAEEVKALSAEAASEATVHFFEKLASLEEALVSMQGRLAEGLPRGEISDALAATKDEARSRAEEVACHLSEELREHRQLSEETCGEARSLASKAQGDVERVVSDMQRFAQEMETLRSRLEATEDLTAGLAKAAPCEQKATNAHLQECGTAACLGLDEVKDLAAAAFGELARDFSTRVGALEAALPVLESSFDEVHAACNEMNKVSAKLQANTSSPEDVAAAKQLAQQAEGTAMGAKTELKEFAADLARQKEHQKALETQISQLQAKSVAAEPPAATAQVPGLEQLKAWSAEAFKESSAELLGRLQQLEEKTNAPISPWLVPSTPKADSTDSCIDAVTPVEHVVASQIQEHVNKAAMIINQECISQMQVLRAAQATHTGEMTKMWSAFDDLKAQAADGALAVELEAAANAAIEELRERLQAVERLQLGERVDGLEAVLRHLAGVAAEQGSSQASQASQSQQLLQTPQVAHGIASGCTSLCGTLCGSATTLNTAKPVENSEPIDGTVTTIDKSARGMSVKVQTLLSEDSTRHSVVATVESMENSVMNVPDCLMNSVSGTSGPISASRSISSMHSKGGSAVPWEGSFPATTASASKIGSSVTAPGGRTLVSPNSVAQSESLRERLQGLVDLVKSAVRNPDSPVRVSQQGSGHAQTGHQQPASALRNTIAGIQTCQLNNSNKTMRMDTDSSQVAGVKTASAVRVMSPRCTPRPSTTRSLLASPRRTTVPGMAAPGSAMTSQVCSVGPSPVMTPLRRHSPPRMGSPKVKTAVVEAPKMQVRMRSMSPTRLHTFPAGSYVGPGAQPCMVTTQAPKRSVTSMPAQPQSPMPAQKLVMFQQQPQTIASTAPIAAPSPMVSPAPLTTPQAWTRS